MTVVTRLMLLSADWERARDRSLRMALPDKVRVIMELPRTRTATGSRNDRKVLDRAVTYIEPTGVFTVFTWQMNAI